MPTPDLVQRVLAGTTYTPRSYTRTTVPTRFELHLMNRMGCGYSRSTFHQLRAAGGALAWFEQQLQPSSITDAPKVGELDGWFPELLWSPKVKWDHHRDGTRPNWEHSRDLGCRTTLRRIYSRRTVLETMVDFWSNHLHVTLENGNWFATRTGYDATIRKHALGRFEDMLLACTLHPSMLVYLDNFRSVKDAPNENHGRELLELHTVGRTSGYTEQMVQDSAKILSGWTVDDRGTWGAVYDPAKHTTGAVTVLGFTHANSAPDGRAVAEAYLRYLARHPSTARTIARKMAVRFVSDTPSEALVQALADEYLGSGTDITAMLRLLVRHADFAASAGGKVSTTVDDLVRTARVLMVDASKPTGDTSFAHAIAYSHGGMLLWKWPRPDGAPERNADWASVSRMLESFRMHWLMGGGYYPDVDVRYRPARAWLPQRRIRLDYYVDHLCRMILGRPSTSRDLKAVCQATGRVPSETVTRTHPLVRYQFPRAVACLLDSPSHMSR